MDRSRLGVAALTGAVFGNLVGYLAYKLNDSLGITFTAVAYESESVRPGERRAFRNNGRGSGRRFGIFVRPAFTVNMTRGTRAGIQVAAQLRIFASLYPEGGHLRCS